MPVVDGHSGRTQPRRLPCEAVASLVLVSLIPALVVVPVVHTIEVRCGAIRLWAGYNEPDVVLRQGSASVVYVEFVEHKRGAVWALHLGPWNYGVVLSR